ncbi:MAG: CBS domain-containing protein [Bryobacter sp.]
MQDPEVKARDIMAAPALTLPPTASLEDAAQLMLAQRVGCVLIANEEGKMLGILTQSDFAARNEGVPFSLYKFPKLFGEFVPEQNIEGLYARARKVPVGEIMSRAVASVKADDDVEVVVKTMLRTGYHRLPVVENGKPVGVIGRHDLLRLMAAGGGN